MLTSNLPALQVVLPLIGAPICALLPARKLAWGFATLVTWLVFAIALSLLFQVSSGEAISYEMGGWQPPFGIEYNVDKLSAFMLVLVSGIASVSMIYAKESVAREIDPERHATFYAVFLLCFTGLLGMIITNDAFNVYVFLEISSLATYALIAMGKDRRALMSSLEYLVLGTVGATFILIAVGLLYIMTGTLNISDLASRLPDLWNRLPVKAALAFFVIGLSLKIAVFPLHLWLTNAYTNAPSFVSAFLSATATKVSIYVLIRVLYTLFGAEFSFGVVFVDKVLIILAIFAIAVGSLVAVFQHNIKRMLAYSSVAQVGYIILGLSLASQMGVTAALVHTFNHALAKAALFMAVGCIAIRVGGVRLSDFKGIGQQMPLTSVAFVLAGLSLMGVPLTAGFVSKWYLLGALMEQQLWLVTGAVLLSSVLAVVYIWRVVEVLYFEQRKKTLPAVKEAPLLMLLSLWVLVGLSLVFGVFSAPVVGAATQAAEYVMGVM